MIEDPHSVSELDDETAAFTLRVVQLCREERDAGRPPAVMLCALAYAAALLAEQTAGENGAEAVVELVANAMREWVAADDEETPEPGETMH